MSIHVRNVRTPTVTTTRGVTVFLVTMRELFQLAKWTFVSEVGGARWSGNIPVDEPGGANGFAVNPASPRVIYDPAGRFTSSMVTNYAMIALRATNDQNRGMWRIRNVTDAYHAEIDLIGENPYGWVAETGIPGRVVEIDTWLQAADEVILAAPSPSNMQIRLNAQDASQYARVYLRPRGKLGSTAEILHTMPSLYYAYSQFFNAYVDGPNVLVWIYADANSTASVWAVGAVDLDEASASDTRPSVLLGHNSLAGTYGTNWDTCSVLDSTDTVQNAYLDFLKHSWSTDIADSLYRKLAARLIQGNVAPIRSPNVWLGNVASGGYRKGKMPAVMALTYYGYDRDRPLDNQGQWLHIAQGISVPRNGPDDPLPVRPL